MCACGEGHFEIQKKKPPHGWQVQAENNTSASGCMTERETEEREERNQVFGARSHKQAARFKMKQKVENLQKKKKKKKKILGFPLNQLELVSVCVCVCVCVCVWCKPTELVLPLGKNTSRANQLCCFIPPPPPRRSYIICHENIDFIAKINTSQTTPPLPRVLHEFFKLLF